MTPFRYYDVVVARPGLQCPKGYLLWEFARTEPALALFGPPAALITEWSNRDEEPLYAEIIELLGKRFSAGEGRRYWHMRHDLLFVSGEVHEGNILGADGEFFRVGPVVGGRAFADRATMTERLQAGVFDRQIARARERSR